jgi:16S rRNA (cytosine967-C5)-methyltransferase
VSDAVLAVALREAAVMVARVASGRSLAEEFRRPQRRAADSTRSALLDLTHGTLRRYGRVQALVRELSHKGRPDATVEALLWCSLYALESGRYADYTVVDQAVRACGLLEKWTAKGYVNALLRAFLRQRASMPARICADLEARFQHPKWWIDGLRAAYPDDWEKVLAAGNSHPPMCLRVNRRRGSVERYHEQLAQRSMAAKQVGAVALLIERPVTVDRLPGFAVGEASVQDAGAQRAAYLLEPASGQRVLDACAAPGGKAAHLLELFDVRLTALDVDAQRCRRIEENVRRLGLQASVVPGDCTRPEQWWDGVPFQRILADVPCSASGIVRRHPDLKWLRRAADLAAFAARQSAILDALWQVLAADGKLLYVTCSVFPEENERVVERFLQRTGNARRMPLADGEAAGRLPGPEHDGFFYALINKQA